jgi:hypothetical protein
MLVREGHIYSHHHIWEDYTGITQLNKFADEADDELAKKGILRPEIHSEDGKLTSSEILKLEQLDWTSDSMMQVYGCRSGLPAPKTGKSTIQCFFETQPSLSTIYGQSGWTFFTDSPDSHNYITPTIRGRLWPDYSGPVYLWAYWRGRNQREFQNDLNYAKYQYNDKMDPVVLSR